MVDATAEQRDPASMVVMLAVALTLPYTKVNKRDDETFKQEKWRAHTHNDVVGAAVAHVPAYIPRHNPPTHMPPRLKVSKTCDMTPSQNIQFTRTATAPGLRAGTSFWTRHSLKKLRFDILSDVTLLGHHF
jgi:hypothetical protein